MVEQDDKLALGKLVFDLLFYLPFVNLSHHSFQEIDLSLLFVQYHM